MLTHSNTTAALRQTLPVALALLTLGLSACTANTTPSQASDSQASDSAFQNQADAPQDFNYDGQDHAWSSPADTSLASLALDAGDNNLSFENWTTASNGWGPIERNKSVGEKNAGDGNTLKLSGKTYDKGFGVHSNSSMTFNIGAKCNTFTSDIGVDAEVASKGSVVFQVFADGSKLYDSGTMTGGSATKNIKVSVSGKKELKLVVTDAGNGLSYDHADWAAPMLLGCSAGSSTSTPTPTAPKPAPVTTIKYSSPIVITKGGTYSGNWESTDSNTTAVYINTKDPVIIENSNIRGKGNLISGFSYNLIVRNVRGYGINPNVAGKSAGKAVNAEVVQNLRVENSYFEHTRGIYVRAFAGDPSKGQTIKILRNQFRNTDGRRSNGNGGYNGEYDIVQAVLFNQVQGIADAEIAWNEIINEPNNSRTEENINMFLSSGTPSSPIRIHDNYIQGAYGINPNDNGTYPGGGILLGDGRTTDPKKSGYGRVYNNQIVSTTNHGLGIAGGTDNQIYDNRVLSSGRTADGKRLPAANVGLYVWDPQGAAKFAPPTFSKNRMANNTVGWTRVGADGKQSNNAMWFPNCGTQSTDCSGNTDMGTVTLTMEKQEFDRWKAKLSSNNVKVGP
ncbi:NPCBM/NEW2 domain-containing protein [Deinococcus sp.]|uniref:NPCBM/NEW2 domain-containing protein n=1 Tax=Deinococcus sp. TaxID=47478 RepID=UPI003B5B19CC